ncbi:hypothetical protein QYM36_003519 [Artemia franciscana]|uniref:Uncharacterized protein n=1 Tax=Artemia franciscana TaxID=6661 RepID=A0AA88I3U3_ARTSF|nr:hypothetical protein QYM36_003519 [Artemia franciscana]
MNAKVGADPKYCLEVLGPHGLGQINENGALLVDFALSNDLVIGGTLFEHKNVHKYTRTSPDGSTRNQIDHFLIARRWRTSLLDVRGYRGADAQSDHMLMIAHIRIKIRAQKKTQQDLKKLYDKNKLQDRKIRRDFCISLWNKFDALAVEANDSKSTYLGYQGKYTAELLERVSDSVQAAPLVILRSSQVRPMRFAAGVSQLSGIKEVQLLGRGAFQEL